MEYKQIRYDYKCSVCNTKKFNDIIEDCEQVYFPQIYDDKNNIHSRMMKIAEILS